MEGNVLEWCLAWYGPYPGAFETDPQGPTSNAIAGKVIRGGAWDGFETDSRSARRGTAGFTTSSLGSGSCWLRLDENTLTKHVNLG
jgi:formylglycine-generating enzyme required for sulfatase activity